MNTHKSVTRLAPGIWRIERWAKQRENRSSWFVTEPDAAFSPDPGKTCREDGQGLCHFSLNGREILAEADTPFTQGFAIGPEDAVYGLGMHQQLALNRRNTVCQMVQINADTIAVPFLTSDAGYALLFDTCAYMSIGIDRPCTAEHLRAYAPEQTSPNRIQIHADQGSFFRYYVILGQTIDEQIRGYRLLTGKAPLLPRWTYGFTQSKEHYHTQAELLEIARTFRSRQIPLDCIVQDWNYWPEQGWNGVCWDRERYPDPGAMLDELHGMDMKLLLSVWSGYGMETPVGQALDRQHLLLHRKDGNASPWGEILDAWNPRAADAAWDWMRENLLKVGVDAWWLDSTEPALGHDCSLDLLEVADTGRGANEQYLNSFALTVSRNLYRRQRAETEDKRVYILTRSGYAGLQSVGACSWTGDIYASWEVFRRQIPALLSYSVSGLPYSTTDIGAFFIEMPGFTGDIQAHPEYEELYTRWFWFGAFSPVFRSHGTSAPREMWRFGEPGTEYFDAQLAADRLRYALMPYLYAQAFRVYAEDSTLMRPLVMDFPGDQQVKNIEDSYLFGPSLLVKVVTRYRQRNASVYLPAGTQGVDFFTGRRYDGGQTVETAAPLDRLPLFARGGSIILMTEPAVCTARQQEQRLQVRLYPGADCQTCYYWDDGDNYSYENGNFAKIVFRWCQQSRTLSVSAPQGAGRFDLHRQLEVYVDNRLVETCAYDEKALEMQLPL